MKSVKFSALVAVAVIAASCAKEGTHSVDESNKVALEPMCIEASDESQTKTVLDGKSVNWTDGDEIAVYSNIDYTTGYRFASTDINGSNSATFSGKVPAGTESFFAVYPPDKVVSVSAEGVTVNIPAEQTPAAGTFAEEHNITVAQGTKTPGVPSVGDIIFNNVCSYVKFTVPAYVSDVKSVTISSDNAIAGDLTVDYTGEKPKYTIAADGAKTTISMSGSFGAGKTFIFVIAPGTVSNFSIDIKTASGNWTRTVSKGFDAKAGVPVNLGTVDFKIASMDATATHTYADDGVTLTGTNLVIKNLNIPDHLTGYVQKVHIDIIPEGKTDAVRSADITDFSTQTSIAVNSTTYPYLPKGNYTIKSTYTMSDGTTSRETTGSFSVPAPTFSVDASLVRTSYDTYYNNGNYNNAAAANNMDGSTIYILNNGVTIHSDILEKYKNLSTVSHTIDGEPVTVDDNGNATNQTWGPHTVVVKFTFDGVTVESPALTRHVTGLPYTANSSAAFSNWTKDKDISTKWDNDGYMKIKQYIEFNGLYVPESTTVVAHSKYGAGYAAVATNFSIYIGGEQVLNFAGKGGFLNTKGNEAETYNNGTISKGNTTIKCESSYSLGNTHSRLWSIKISYR